MYRLLLYALLTVAAATRLLLHIAAMPPYAGLDEIYHVARLSFVAAEGRNPTTREPSIAPYLHRSMLQQPDALPSFAHIAERWPDVVRQNPTIVNHRPLTAADLHPYVMANYEAQHPPLYYSLTAPFVHLLDERSAASELRLWRLWSVLFAIVVVLAAARAGEILFGPVGVFAAASLLLMPTWFTLVARVANDALACALIALGFMLTITAPRRWSGIVAEGLFWSAAIATKLYAWPVAVIVPLLWWKQKARRQRVVFVLAICALAAAFTVFELSQRTENPTGIVALNRPGGTPLPATVDFGEIARVTIASLAWTSGQHGNALRPLAIAIYLGPVLLLVLWLLHYSERSHIGVAAIALLTFAAAQALNVVLSVLARRSGNDIPIGGKEGWYWYALAPIIAVLILGSPARAWPRVTAGLFVWLALWDVLIHESALFQDFAGRTSSIQPTALFRWGPLHMPFTADLIRIGIGPLQSHLVALRVLELLALGLIITVFWAPAPNRSADEERASN